MRDLAILNEFADGRLEEELGNLNHEELGQVEYWQKWKAEAEAEGRWVHWSRVQRKYESTTEKRERERQERLALELERIRRAAFNRQFKKRRLNDLPAQCLAPKVPPPNKLDQIVITKDAILRLREPLPSFRLYPRAFVAEAIRRYVIGPIKARIKRFYGTYGAIVKVQAVFRGHRARNFVAMLRNEYRTVLRLSAVVTIQRRWRGYLGRCYYLWKRQEYTKAAIKIQRCVRNFLNRLRIQRLKRMNMAATLIQAQWRGYYTRRKFESLLELAFNRQLHLSETYKRIIANRWQRAYYLVKYSAIKIQRCYRRFIAYLRSVGYSMYIKRMRAAYILQWAWRMYKWHRLVWEVVEDKKRRHRAATKVAAMVRAVMMRRWYKVWRRRQLRRILLAQRLARGWITRHALRERRQQYHILWTAAQRVKKELNVQNLLDSLTSSVDGDDQYKRSPFEEYPELKASLMKQPPTPPEDIFQIDDELERHLKNKKSAIPLLKNAHGTVTSRMKPDSLAVKVGSGSSAYREFKKVIKTVPSTTLKRTVRAPASNSKAAQRMGKLDNSLSGSLSSSISLASDFTGMSSIAGQGARNKIVLGSKLALKNQGKKSKRIAIESGQPKVLALPSPEAHEAIRTPTPEMRPVVSVQKGSGRKIVKLEKSNTNQFKRSKKAINHKLQPIPLTKNNHPNPT
mmetsp:Transcript_24416/g.31896  ORF Transcript_24416/g.31896 Transcript_24416/m.31896 type:complete len:683 (+) Transcript_24416:119-2167(+)